MEYLDALDEPLIELYIDYLYKLAMTLDKDRNDKILMERVVEKIREFAKDDSAMFILNKTDEEIDAIGTVIMKNDYVYIAQIAVKDASRYTELIVKILKRLQDDFPEAQLYGIVKDSIWQAVEAYKEVGGRTDPNFSFPEFENYKARGGFTPMDFSVRLY